MEGVLDGHQISGGHLTAALGRLYSGGKAWRLEGGYY